MRNLLRLHGSTFEKGGAKSFALLFPKVDFWVYLFLKGKVKPNILSIFRIPPLEKVDF